eukprot:7601597-Heterocapsa_arctica.AAC.1
MDGGHAEDGLQKDPVSTREIVLILVANQEDGCKDEDDHGHRHKLRRISPETIIDEEEEIRTGVATNKQARKRAEEKQN